jgi:hypothetical protein
MTGVTALLADRPGQFYLAVVLALIVLLALGRRLGPVFFITAFPATLAHELTHLVFGWLSNGRPAGLRLLPRRSARGYVLGSVTCNNVRWYNGLFIGLAPLALLPFALLLFRWRVHTAAAMEAAELAWVYAIACLALAALPSWQDLRVAFASSWLLLLMALSAAGWHFGWFVQALH